MTLERSQRHESSRTAFPQPVDRPPRREMTYQGTPVIDRLPRAQPEGIQQRLLHNVFGVGRMAEQSPGDVKRQGRVGSHDRFPVFPPRIHRLHLAVRRASNVYNACRAERLEITTAGGTRGRTSPQERLIRRLPGCCDCLVVRALRAAGRFRDALLWLAAMAQTEWCAKEHVDQSASQICRRPRGIHWVHANTCNDLPTSECCWS